HGSRNVATGGGTLTAISVINSSEMTPGPLGISDTSPTASAPHSTAARASSTLAMQQTLTRGRIGSIVLRQAGINLLFQFDDGGAGTALVLGGEVKACDVRMVAEQVGDGAAQGACAVT